MKKRIVLRIVLLAFILVVGIAAVYFSFFYNYNCNSLECFKAHQEECAKTKFTNSNVEGVWRYQIQGVKDNRCIIDVELVELKQGNIDRKILEKKSMTCKLPIGDVSSPESDISKCTGELKEGMQEFIIQRLHQYIIENLGQIGSELRDF